MPEMTQYSFTLKEVTEALVSNAGITSGHWQLVVNFGFAAGSMGTDDNNLNPSALVAVQQLSLNRVEQKSNLSVDASELRKKQAPSKKPD